MALVLIAVLWWELLVFAVVVIALLGNSYPYFKLNTLKIILIILNSTWKSVVMFIVRLCVLTMVATIMTMIEYCLGNVVIVMLLLKLLW